MIVNVCYLFGLICWGSFCMSEYHILLSVYHMYAMESSQVLIVFFFFFFPIQVHLLTARNLDIKK